MKRVTVLALVAAFVTVVAPAALACDTSSWITPDSPSGGPGTPVQITGAGFEPGTVLIRWDASAERGGEVLGEAQVGDDGNLSAHVTVPADAAPGAHKFVAEHTNPSAEGPAHVEAWVDYNVPGDPAPQEPEGSANAEPATAENAQPSAGKARSHVARSAEASQAESVRTESTTSVRILSVEESVAGTTATNAVVRSESTIAQPRPFDLDASSPSYAVVPDTAPVALESGHSDEEPATPLRDRLAVAGAVLLALALLGVAWLRRRTPDPQASVVEILGPESSDKPERRAA